MCPREEQHTTDVSMTTRAVLGAHLSHLGKGDELGHQAERLLAAHGAQRLERHAPGNMRAGPLAKTTATESERDPSKQAGSRIEVHLLLQHP